MHCWLGKGLPHKLPRGAKAWRRVAALARTTTALRGRPFARGPQCARAHVHPISLFPSASVPLRCPSWPPPPPPQPPHWPALATTSATPAYAPRRRTALHSSVACASRSCCRLRPNSCARTRPPPPRAPRRPPPPPTGDPGGAGPYGRHAGLAAHPRVDAGGQRGRRRRLLVLRRRRQAGGRQAQPAAQPRRAAGAAGRAVVCGSGAAAAPCARCTVYACVRACTVAVVWVVCGALHRGPRPPGGLPSGPEAGPVGGLAPSRRRYPGPLLAPPARGAPSLAARQVAGSGKPFAIVRAFGTDRTDDDYPLADSIQVRGGGAANPNPDPDPWLNPCVKSAGHQVNAHTQMGTCARTWRTRINTRKHAQQVFKGACCGMRGQRWGGRREAHVYRIPLRATHVRGAGAATGGGEAGPRRRAGRGRAQVCQQHTALRCRRCVAHPRRDRAPLAASRAR